MTYSELKNKLSEAGVASPDFEAAELIRFYTGTGSASLRFGDYNSKELLCAVEKRLSGMPLQYVIGQWDFMGHTFKVDPRCLIPRADTELLCSYLIENAPEGGIFCDDTQNVNITGNSFDHNYGPAIWFRNSRASAASCSA